MSAFAESFRTAVTLVLEADPVLWRTVRLSLAVSDYVTEILIADLLRTAHGEAPHISFELRPVGRRAAPPPPPRCSPPPPPPGGARPTVRP